MKDLIELLSTYSVGEILIFIVLLALAFKGVVDFYDWAKKRIRGHVDDINKTESEKSNTASKKLNIVFEKNDFDANNEIVKSFLNSAMASQSRKLKEKSEWDKIKGDTSQLGFIDRIYSVKEIYGFTDAHMTNFQNK